MQPLGQPEPMGSVRLDANQLEYVLGTEFVTEISRPQHLQLSDPAFTSNVAYVVAAISL